MRLGIRAKLFGVSLWLIMVSVVGANAYLGAALNADLTQRIEHDLLIRLQLIERAAAQLAAAQPTSLDGKDINAVIDVWDALADDLGRRSQGRVTIIGKDGRVLGDSDLDDQALLRLERHDGRPEVVAALRQGRGTTMRYSSTLKRRMIYVAIPFPKEAPRGTVRLAQPLTEVDEALGRLRRMLVFASAIGLGLAVLMSTLAARWMSRTIRTLTRVARRMAHGDLTVRTQMMGHDELAELGRALDQLAHGLQNALGSLQSERDRMERVLNGMREGILLLDRSGRVALANAALRKMLRLGPEMVGKAPIEIIRHADLKQLLDGAATAIAPVSAEIELGDGEGWRWSWRSRRLLVRAASLPDEPGVLASFVDVTDLRRLENVRRDFVANVSHELRTPVAAVRSAAETLRRAMDTDPEAAVEFVAIIERNAERLHRLIEDLLDLSRIESREFEIALKPVEIRPIAEHVMSLYHEKAAARQIRLVIDLPPDIPAVLADRRALDQVLSNLVDNAVKYGREGGAVTLSVYRQGAKVKLAVADTGPGIEGKHLSRIFERFYRVDAGRSRELGGTGLGLSIVKHLVEAMGGEVSVESVVGQGTTFSFALACADGGGG